MLMPATLNECPTVTLSTRCPTLIAARMLRDTPDAISHALDVSDAHTVRSHDDPPVRAVPVTEAAASPDPVITTTAEPVVAALTRRTELRRLASVEWAEDMLPDTRPTLIAARRLPAALAPDRHTKEVSDSHLVASQAVCSVLL